MEGTLTRFNLNLEAFVSLHMGFLWEGGDGKRVPGEDWQSEGVDCRGALLRDKFPKSDENLEGFGLE